jgi:hypothetical protein
MIAVEFAKTWTRTLTKHERTVLQEWHQLRERGLQPDPEKFDMETLLRLDREGSGDKLVQDCKYCGEPVVDATIEPDAHDGCGWST